MKVAYLVNQYPHTSHSFIRREVMALEAQDVEVLRFSIRRAGVELVDAGDRAESLRTRVILEAGLGYAALAVARRALVSPGRFLSAAMRALSAGRRSDRGVARHLICLAEACVLARWLEEAGVEHLHAHFGTNSAAVAALCSRISGISYSFTVHGPEEFDRAGSLDLERKIAGAAFVIAISEFGRSQLYRWCGREHWGKIHVVRCGVDAAFATGEVSHVPSASRLVCVGRLCEQKGQLLLIEAAARLAGEGRNFEVDLVGDGPMRGTIERLISERGLACRVRLLGWMSGPQVRERILASRAMVLPSFAEGLPVVIMEALALNRPVISTYVAGIPELIEPGVSGWLVPAGSVDALAAAMREALDAPVVRLEQMGRAGAARVAECHSASREAARLLELLAGAMMRGSDQTMRPRLCARTAEARSC